MAAGNNKSVLQPCSGKRFTAGVIPFSRLCELAAWLCSRLRLEMEVRVAGSGIFRVLLLGDSPQSFSISDDLNPSGAVARLVRSTFLSPVGSNRKFLRLSNSSVGILLIASKLCRKATRAPAARMSRSTRQGNWSFMTRSNTISLVVYNDVIVG